MKRINQLFFVFFLFINHLYYAALPELHQAACDGNLKQVQCLLDAGEDANGVDQEGDTPLHVAAINNCEAVVNLLLKRDNVKLDVANKWGHTLLHNAVYGGNEVIVNLLLDRGVDVNAPTNLGSTPLHWVVKSGCERLVELLLKRGADLNAVGNYGNTPLRIAERSRHSEVVTLLKNWPKYQNLFRKRREQMFAFMMVTHPHFGVASPAKVLPRELFPHIWGFVKPTIEEADNLKKRGIVTTIIGWFSCLFSRLNYQKC